MSQFTLCPHCQGSGYGDNLGDVTEWVQEDPDFADDYRAGVYNTGCPRCKGLRVVPRCEAAGCDQPVAEGHWYDDESAESFEEGPMDYLNCYDHLSEAQREWYDEVGSMLRMEAAERAVGA